jgi:hypothetical protein
MRLLVARRFQNQKAFSRDIWRKPGKMVETRQPNVWNDQWPVLLTNIKRPAGPFVELVNAERSAFIEHPAIELLIPLVCQLPEDSFWGIATLSAEQVLDIRHQLICFAELQDNPYLAKCAQDLSGWLETDQLHINGF